MAISYTCHWMFTLINSGLLKAQCHLQMLSAASPLLEPVHPMLFSTHISVILLTHFCFLFCVAFLELRT